MLRAWQVEDGYHTIINFSIKHPVSEEQAGLEGCPVTGSQDPTCVWGKLELPEPIAISFLIPGRDPSWRQLI